MSWLRIIHETKYTYERAVAFGRHQLVLRPREGHDLRVESLELNISPAAEVQWSRDIFNNVVSLVDFTAPADELVIRSDVLVWRSIGWLPPIDADETPWPVSYSPLEAGIAAIYLQPVYPDDQAAVQAWLQSADWKKPATAEALLDALNRRINREITYARREEKGVFTPAQTLALKRGSCRDMATLLLESARALGIASRFASGYLDCEAADEGLASTHAWVEAYLPVQGWLGYDPSSGRPTSAQHVVTGVSNHPRGVMPVSGYFMGDQKSFKAMTVVVKMERPDSPPPTSAPLPRVLAGEAAVGG